MDNTSSPSSQPSVPSSESPVTGGVLPHPSESNRFKEIKSLVIKILIGCLIAAAGVSVVAVLTGGFTDTLTRALTTLLLVAVHALAALTYINTSEIKRDENSLTFFSNVVFVVILLSFITSVFGTWQFFDWEFLWKAYATYFVLMFAALHGNMLHQAKGKTSTIDYIVYANYVFMVLVIGMLLPIIYLNSETFANFYYRILAAVGIIDATLSIVAVSLHRLYLNKHPEQTSNLFALTPGSTEAKPAARHINPIVLLVGLYIVGQIVVSLFFGLMSLGQSRSSHKLRVLSS